ncbi:MAG TPA: hypothetical protein VMC84_11685 [Methanocella sp.]|uniref:hypothetical protein n=1 Tax=Methanocella sp. TaxID=2052833 RepID=UPI002CAAA2B0|nr:hypothetical protein [Methanocella sp.]HTY91829.1 hypothetical protein [Methanocella sp.]
MLRDDDSGQFLLLTGVVISIGMVILLIFLNQSSMGGYSSSDSIMSFPKNDIRDLRIETINEAISLGARENNNPYYGYNNSTRGQIRSDMFNASFIGYASDIASLSARNGYLASVSAIPGVENQTISNATVSVYYNNGETMYNETLTVVIA